MKNKWCFFFQQCLGSLISLVATFLSCLQTWRKADWKFCIPLLESWFIQSDIRYIFLKTCIYCHKIARTWYISRTASIKKIKKGLIQHFKIQCCLKTNQNKFRLNELIILEIIQRILLFSKTVYFLGNFMWLYIFASINVKKKVLTWSYTETQAGPAGKLDYHSDGNIIMCLKHYRVSIVLHRGTQSTSCVLYHLSSQHSNNVGRGQP